MMTAAARGALLGIGVLAVAGLAAGPACAQWPLPGPAAPQARPPAPPKPKPAPAPDPAFEAARSAFEALPEAERRALQDALVWTGDYNSVINGAFGRRTYDAILAWRTRENRPGETLDARARAGILAAAEAARRAARFSLRTDPASGVVIGVPEARLPKRTALPGGTRWQSADGRITLETRSAAPGETDLDALFERTIAPVPGRKITYKLKRPDFFVVTGDTAEGRFYIRHAAGPETVRGFVVAYDKALAGEADRLVIAIANSFEPFPAAGTPVAPVPGPAASQTAATAQIGTAPRTGMASQAGASPQAAPLPGVRPGVPAPTPGFMPGPARAPAGTGLVVAPGRVLTAAAAVENCPATFVGAAPARIAASDPGTGLALLEVGSAAKAVAPAPRGAPPAVGEALVTLASDGTEVQAAPGALVEGGRLQAPLQPGSAGAPVFDRSGALVGVVARFPAQVRLVAGIAPPMSHALLPASALAGFLAAHGIAAAPAPAAETASLGAVAGRLGGAVMAVVCRR
ncbi:S1 family peptidase [Methylobacterium jeotgali]|nr:serine protease [Methylobacterium jeotgali]